MQVVVGTRQHKQPEGFFTQEHKDMYHKPYPDLFSSKIQYSIEHAGIQKKQTPASPFGTHTLSTLIPWTVYGIYEPTYFLSQFQKIPIECWTFSLKRGILQ